MRGPLFGFPINLNDTERNEDQSERAVATAASFAML